MLHKFYNTLNSTENTHVSYSIKHLASYITTELVYFWMKPGEYPLPKVEPVFCLVLIEYANLGVST